MYVFSDSVSYVQYQPFEHYKSDKGELSGCKVMSLQDGVSHKTIIKLVVKYETFT